MKRIIVKKEKRKRKRIFRRERNREIRGEENNNKIIRENFPDETDMSLQIK